MAERTIKITVEQGRTGTWSLTATISLPHKGKTGIRQVPVKTITRTLNHPHADLLTPALLTEWVTALTLVAAGWYEQESLPF